MRFLILALVAYIAAVVSFRRPKGLDAPDPPEADPAPDGGLPQRLSEAAATFRAASDQAEGAPAFASALSALAERCTALSARATADQSFARRSRVPITRLLLPLYGVAQRASILAARTKRSDEAEETLSHAASLLTRAVDALERTENRADVTLLRHLEADLEVLADRLER